MNNHTSQEVVKNMMVLLVIQTVGLVGFTGLSSFYVFCFIYDAFKASESSGAFLVAFSSTIIYAKTLWNVLYSFSLVHLFPNKKESNKNT